MHPTVTAPSKPPAISTAGGATPRSGTWAPTRLVNASPSARCPCDDERLHRIEEQSHGLVRTGNVRYVGCSNWTARELVKALGIADRYGWARRSASQAYRSILGRDLDLDLLQHLG